MTAWRRLKTVALWGDGESAADDTAVRNLIMVEFGAWPVGIDR